MQYIYVREILDFAEQEDKKSCKKQGIDEN
jgi:hypothetical protein